MHAASHFSCFRDGLKIRGTIFYPEDRPREKLPIAIVCHEYMANQLFSYPYAKALARCGYATFCFDFCGGGLVSASQGSSRNMSVLTEIADLKAVIRFAREQPDTDKASLLLMGCSQGGLVAALTAAAMPDEINGLILQYPALCIPDAARNGDMLWLKFDPAHIPDKMHAGPMRLGRRYVTDVMELNVFQAISGYTGRVLLIHGDQDTIVSLEYARKALAVYQSGGTDAKLVIIPGGKHIFRRPAHIRQAKEAIKAFVQKGGIE